MVNCKLKIPNSQLKEDHPLYRFHYCPLCGSGSFLEHGANARRCQDCGFTYYTNPRGATVALIINEYDELLCGRRANDPARGTRDLVGGFMDLDETAEQGMCREIAEESGLQIEPSQLHYLFSQPNRYPYSGIMCRTIDLFFEVRVKGRPQFDGQDDIASLEWLPLSTLPVEEFGLGSIREGLTRYLASRNSR